MLVFPAIGLLLWIAFLLAALVLASILWALSSLAFWITGLKPRTSPKIVTSAPAPASSDIWPKWTPAHRRYVDEELALWQEQFDALSSSK